MSFILGMNDQIWLFCKAWRLKSFPFPWDGLYNHESFVHMHKSFVFWRVCFLLYFLWYISYSALLWECLVWPPFRLLYLFNLSIIIWTFRKKKLLIVFFHVNLVLKHNDVGFIYVVERFNGVSRKFSKRGLPYITNDGCSIY